MISLSNNTWKYMLCTAAGVAAGYWFASERLQQNYMNMLRESEEELRDYYRNRYVEGAVQEGEPEDFARDAVAASEAIQNYQGLDVPPVVLTDSLMEVARKEAQKDASEERETARSTSAPGPVQPEDGGKVDYNAISKAPTKPAGGTVEETGDFQPGTKPEIIPILEFQNSTTGYKQLSMTYYAGDNILAGESDNVLNEDQVLMTVGPEIRKYLKDGADGKRELYVRNGAVKMEFDLAISAGNYTDEVGPIDSSG